jgi:hypothetical protein
MRLSLAACASLILVLLVSPAAALAADTVRPSYEGESVSIPPGGTRGLTLDCPSGAVALNAAVSRRGSGVTVRRSTPGTDAGRWSFRASNRTSGRRRLSAIVRCVRLTVPVGVSRVQLLVRTLMPPAFDVPAGGTADSDVRCPRGWVPTGYGIHAGADAGDVNVTRAVPSARSWSFTFENTGVASADASVRVRCLRQTVTGRRAGERSTLRFSFARPRFENTGIPTGDGFTHRCGRGQFAVAAGVSYDPQADVVLDESFAASERFGVWLFRRSETTETISSSIVCLRRGSRFG